MTYYKKLLGMACVVTLTGCAIHNPILQTESNKTTAVNDWADLVYYPITLKGNEAAQQIDLKAGSPILSQPGGESYAVGWELPDYGVHQLKVMSKIERSTFNTKAHAFMPDVALLNKDYELIQVLPAEDVEYKKPGLNTNEYVYHEFVVDNRSIDPYSPRYIAIYSSPAAQNMTVEVMDFDKEYAKVRSVLPPFTKGVLATAAGAGTISIEVTGDGLGKPVVQRPSTFEPPVPTGRSERATVASLEIDEAEDAVMAEVADHISYDRLNEALALRNELMFLNRDLQRAYNAGGTMTSGTEYETTVVQWLSSVYFDTLNSSDNATKVAVLDRIKDLISNVDDQF